MWSIPSAFSDLRAKHCNLLPVIQYFLETTDPTIIRIGNFADCSAHVLAESLNLLSSLIVRSEFVQFREVEVVHGE